MRFSGDVDIDLSADGRELLLQKIKHIPAAMRNVKPIRRHATGVYITDIPRDPILGAAALDYTAAEQRGYFKLDLLTVHVYNQVRDEAHLTELMREPDWSMLRLRSVVLELIHLSNHFQSICRMPEPIDSIPRLAMFLAIIRPAKNHLIGKPWSEVAKEVWEKDADGEYAFKRSHSVGYAQLVAVHMNLIAEQKAKASSSPE